MRVFFSFRHMLPCDPRGHLLTSLSRFPVNMHHSTPPPSPHPFFLPYHRTRTYAESTPPSFSNTQDFNLPATARADGRSPRMTLWELL